MPPRMTRSAPQSPFELPEVRAVIRATRLSCQNAGKAQKFTPVQGFIWRISVYGIFGDISTALPTPFVAKLRLSGCMCAALHIAAIRRCLRYTTL